MICKDGVQLEGLTEKTLRALLKCDGVFRTHNLEMMITSAKDQPQAHGVNSLHKEGKAFDLRLPSRIIYSELLMGGWNEKTHNIDWVIAEEITEQLGPDFQVILEHHQTYPWAWHIHCELDPR